MPRPMRRLSKRWNARARAKCLSCEWAIGGRGARARLHTHLTRYPGHTAELTRECVITYTGVIR